jgi:uncharacterized protein involved in type VI secretion and phage assembly
MSLYRGIVTDVADPAGLGRWSVEVPSVSTEPLWALTVVPLGAGGVQPLEVGTNVWVAFEEDGFSSPVVLGSIPPTES